MCGDIRDYLKNAMHEVDIYCSNIIDTFSGSKIIYTAYDEKQPFSGNLYLKDVKLETITQVSADKLSVASIGLNLENSMSGNSKDTEMAQSPVESGLGSGISLVDGSHLAIPDIIANKDSILTKSAFTLPRASCPICHKSMAKRSLWLHKKSVHGLTPKKPPGGKVRQGRLFNSLYFE